jgi:hypothetical protein
MVFLMLAACALLGAAVGGTAGFVAAGTTVALVGAGVGALAGAGIAGTAYALNHPRGYWYPAPYPYQYWPAPYPTCTPVYYAQPPRSPIFYYSPY